MLASVPRHEDVWGSGDITLRILQPRACWKSLVKVESRGSPPAHIGQATVTIPTLWGTDRYLSTSAGNQTPNTAVVEVFP